MAVAPDILQKTRNWLKTVKSWAKPNLVVFPAVFWHFLWWWAFALCNASRNKCFKYPLPIQGTLEKFLSGFKGVWVVFGAIIVAVPGLGFEIHFLCLADLQIILAFLASWKLTKIGTKMSKIIQDQSKMQYRHPISQEFLTVVCQSHNPSIGYIPTIGCTSNS